MLIYEDPVIVFLFSPLHEFPLKFEVKVLKECLVVGSVDLNW